MYETAKLRGRIVEKYGTIGKFAEAVGKTRAAVSNYLNGSSNLSQDVILQWCDLLDISEKEIPAYFFTLKQ